MANSEWVLCVQVEHFENLYNAEIRNDEYCCCDVSYLVVPCVQVVTDINVAECTSECEPYLEIRFEVCFANRSCSNIKCETAVIDNSLATCISPLHVQLHSEESTIDNVTNVSASKILICVCVYY